MNVIELCPNASLDFKQSHKKHLSMDMSMIRERMDALGIDLASLNRRYCDIRQKKGDTKAVPVNRRNMLAKAISNDGNPTLETFMDIIAALDGEVLIEWRDKRIERLVSSEEDYHTS